MLAREFLVPPKKRPLFDTAKDIYLFRATGKNMRFPSLLAYASLLALTAAQSTTLPQCSQSFNGTIGNGTVGSEQQIKSTTVRTVNATDANQGVAVDRGYFYSIDNFSITKHNKTTGQAIAQWYGGKGGPIIHLDGGVVINGTLFAPHSSMFRHPPLYTPHNISQNTLHVSRHGMI